MMENSKLKMWMTELESELIFWTDIISGNSYRDKEEYFTSKKPFLFEEEALEYGDKVDFLDVGSGPFFSCGLYTNKIDLNYFAVDPLANAYNRLNEKYKIYGDQRIETGFVELLNFKYDCNSFDIVHMSNALDHSFDPIVGLLSMLFVLRVNGKIILRHYKDEAEHADYQGLHQWNIETDSMNNTFYIWNKKERINIDHLLGEKVKIKVYDQSKSESFQRVIIRKLDNITYDNTEIYNQMFYAGYDSLIDNIYKHVNEITLLGMQDSFSKSIRLKILKAKYILEEETDLLPNTIVDIYGFGKIGKELFMMLYDLDIRVGYIIDKKANSRNGITIIKPEDYLLEESHLLVLSIGKREQTEVRQEFQDRGIDGNGIMGVDGFVEAIMKKGKKS